MNWTPEEKNNLPSKYGCDLLLEEASMDQLKDPSFPNDAYIVTYQIDGTKYKDLCRGSRVKIFDLYYDKFGPGVIQDIGFGYGRTNPKLWGENNSKKTKKKK